MSRTSTKLLGLQLDALMDLQSALERARFAAEVKTVGQDEASLADFASNVEESFGDVLAEAQGRVFEIFMDIGGTIDTAGNHARGAMAKSSRAAIETVLRAAGWEDSAISYVFDVVEDSIVDGCFFPEPSGVPNVATQPAAPVTTSGGVTVKPVARLPDGSIVLEVVSAGELTPGDVGEIAAAAEGVTFTNPEACPGCGRMPGEGVNPACDDAGGCGFWKAENAAAVQRIEATAAERAAHTVELVGPGVRPSAPVPTTLAEVARAVESDQICGALPLFDGPGPCTRDRGHDGFHAAKGRHWGADEAQHRDAQVELLAPLPYEAPPTTLDGPGIRLILDVRQVFPDDPGNGTPAIVETRNGKFSASYNCALGTGELSGSGGNTRYLTSEQIRWLDEQLRHVEEVWRQGEERAAIKKARTEKGPDVLSALAGNIAEIGPLIVEVDPDQSPVTSSACKREPWCVLQIGHDGPCLPTMMRDGSF